MADHSKWCKVTCEVKEIAKLSDCDEDLLHFVMALALKRPIGEEVRKFQQHVIILMWYSTRNCNVLWSCF